MGGQQFARRALLVGDTARTGPPRRRGRGLAEVGAGVRPAQSAAREHAVVNPAQRGGADDLSRGRGSRRSAPRAGLSSPPLVADVSNSAIVVRSRRGDVLTCSRDEHPGLFRLACGGYGLFGAIYSVREPPRSRTPVGWTSSLVRRDKLVPRLEERAADSWLAGDVQLQIDPASQGIPRRRTYFYCVRPAADGAVAARKAGAPRGGVRSSRLAHSEGARPGSWWRAGSGAWGTSTTPAAAADRICLPLARVERRPHRALHPPSGPRGFPSRRLRANCARERRMQSTRPCVSSSETTRRSSPGRARRGHACRSVSTSSMKQWRSAGSRTPAAR